MSGHSTRGIAAITVLIVLAVLFWKKISSMFMTSGTVSVSDGTLPLSKIPAGEFNLSGMQPAVFTGATTGPTLAQAGRPNVTLVPYGSDASGLTANDMTAIDQASYFGIGTE